MTTKETVNQPSTSLPPPPPAPLHKKSSHEDLTYQFQSIKLPLLQMTDPYYPHSKLAKSIFSGYYILFFMYSVIFTITYPLLNFLEGQDLFGITIIKLVETNILWDCISAVLFIFMAVIFIQIQPIFGKILSGHVMMVIAFVSFMFSGIYIIKSYPMYFTDRIFIVVLNWAVCAKTLTYIYDKNQSRKRVQSTLVWSKQQSHKKMHKLSKKLLYLISPYPVYHKFVLEHTPSLKIHRKYLLTKLFVSFLCLLVNNILIVKFIQPACHDTNLSFVALTFKLVPLTFYINMVLYYMVLDNVFAALAQATQIRDRMFYLDWWNAETVYQFLDKWCLVINMTTQQLFPSINIKIRHTLHVTILQILLLTIFGQSINLFACIGFITILMIVYFLGGVQIIQNNMIVHVLCMSFTPVMIALEVKYSIFSQGIFG